MSKSTASSSKSRSYIVEFGAKIKIVLDLRYSHVFEKALEKVIFSRLAKYGEALKGSMCSRCYTIYRCCKVFFHFPFRKKMQYSFK